MKPEGRGHTDEMTQSKNLPTDSGEPSREVDEATVHAVGAVSEALEYVERARGELYAFHHLMGHADLLLGEACDKLRDAGHNAVADRLQTEMIGRNVFGRPLDFSDSGGVRRQLLVILSRPRAARTRGTARRCPAPAGSKDERAAPLRRPSRSREPAALIQSAEPIAAALACEMSSTA